MVRTIYIVFSDDFFKSCSKEYMFLCNYDIVKVGDIIRDPRYSTDMKVINITSDTRRIQYGITLKDIYITHINGNLIVQPSGLVNGTIIGSDFDIDKQRNNNMEKRNIKVTLEQAIEWYNSGNETLRTLALTVFTKEELTLNMEYIKNNTPSCSYCLILPVVESRKAYALADLAVIAKYFNGDWEKTPNNTGYFLGQSNTDSVKDVMKGVKVMCHNTVKYPGVVYFRNPEDPIKAMKILGDRARDLFK